MWCNLNMEEAVRTQPMPNIHFRAAAEIPTSVLKCRSELQMFSLPIFEKAPKHGTADAYNNNILEKHQNEPYYIVKVLFYMPVMMTDKVIEENR